MSKVKLTKALDKITGKERDFIQALLDKQPVEQVYADWLSEQDREAEAAILRAKAGISKVYFTLRHKPSGLLWKKYQAVSPIKQALHKNHVGFETNKNLAEQLVKEGKAISSYGNVVMVSLEDCEIAVIEAVETIYHLPLPWKVVYEENKRNKFFTPTVTHQVDQDYDCHQVE